MGASPPRPQTGSRLAELRLLGLLGALWLGAWSCLTIATAAAGGRPTRSPTAMLGADRLLSIATATGPAPWRLVSDRAPPHPVLFLLVLAVTAGGATALPVWGWRRLRRGWWGTSRPPQRSSRWARRVDLRTLRSRRPQAGRFTLGRHGAGLLLTAPETSVLVIGPTRSGKTSALVVPNLLEWAGPAVATSTKSELLDLTAARRRTRGPVLVYDPTGDLADRRPTVRWSPLAGCDDLDHAWTVASWLCAGLQSGGGRQDNDWAHWAESGKLLVAPLLHAAAAGGGSIVDVRDWITSFDLDTPAALLEERASGESIADGDAQRALRMLRSIDQRPERERGTVFSTVMRIVTVFNERSVARSAQASELDARALLREGGTLYLCTPQEAPQRVASLFVAVLMTVVTAAYRLAAAAPDGRLTPELGLFLDELANVVPIEDLPALASQGAGRGVLLMSIVQDLSQLRSRYGPDRANSILNNHGCRMVLPGIADPETAETMARLVGRADRTEMQVSRGASGMSRSYSVRQEQLAPADTLRQLAEGTAVVVHRGLPPVMVWLRPWYATRRLRHLAPRAPPPPPVQFVTSLAREPTTKSGFSDGRWEVSRHGTLGEALAAVARHCRRRGGEDGASRPPYPGAGVAAGARLHAGSGARPPPPPRPRPGGGDGGGDQPVPPPGSSGPLPDG